MGAHPIAGLPNRDSRADPADLVPNGAANKVNTLTGAGAIVSALSLIHI